MKTMRFCRAMGWMRVVKSSRFSRTRSFASASSNPQAATGKPSSTFLPTPKLPRLKLRSSTQNSDSENKVKDPVDKNSKGLVRRIDENSRSD